MRKFVSILMSIVVLIASLACVSCGDTDTGFKTVAKEDIKIGLITLHDDSSTYDKNFIEAMYRALENKGLSEDQLVLYTGVAETSDCYDKAKACATAGCQVVFADSFGHEDFIIQAAQEFSDVRFCHATGTKAHTANLDNYSNAFAAIYEGRYAAGVAAGMKLNEMIEENKITADEAVVGYVGAYTYAEVISGMTSFFLGVRSVCPSATMKVRFTGTWYDTDKEYAAAKSLIETDKCVLLSQHADSYGAPNACEEAGVPNISYNGSTEAQGPNTYIISSKINWTPYFEYMIDCVLNGETIEKDYVGTFATDSVQILFDENNTVAAKGTYEAITKVIEDFKAGNLFVFSTDTWTIDGKTLTEYMADVDYDAEYVKDTQVIENGVFYESKFRSAPYFDLNIDGITYINTAY